ERAWRGALGDATQANLDRFLTARPQWSERTEDVVLASYDAGARRALTGDLLAQLAPFTEEDAATEQRLRLLRRKAETAESAAYRMEVRLGALLRMRAVLTTIAGRMYLATRGTHEERSAYQRLVACEDVSLASSAPAPKLTATRPFPPYEDDVRLARHVLPA